MKFEKQVFQTAGSERMVIMMLNVEAFASTLPVMLYGLAGIFAVIAVIILCLKLLIFIFPASNKDTNGR